MSNLPTVKDLRRKIAHLMPPSVAVDGQQAVVQALQ